MVTKERRENGRKVHPDPKIDYLTRKYELPKYGWLRLVRKARALDVVVKPLLELIPDMGSPEDMSSFLHSALAPLLNLPPEKRAAELTRFRKKFEESVERLKSDTELYGKQITGKDEAEKMTRGITGHNKFLAQLSGLDRTRLAERIIEVASYSNGAAWTFNRVTPAFEELRAAGFKGPRLAKLSLSLLDLEELMLKQVRREFIVNRQEREKRGDTNALFLSFQDFHYAHDDLVKISMLLSKLANEYKTEEDKYNAVNYAIDLLKRRGYGEIRSFMTSLPFNTTGKAVYNYIRAHSN